MSQKLNKSSLADFTDLFGPPPVLRTENLENFERLFDQVMACIKPQDVIEIHLGSKFRLCLVADRSVQPTSDRMY